MLLLRGVDVHEMDPNSPFAAMAHDGAHLHFPLALVLLDSEVHLDFHTDWQLPFGEDADSDRAHVRQETGRQVTVWSKQDTPIGRTPRTAPPFASQVVSQGGR